MKFLKALGVAAAIFVAVGPAVARQNMGTPNIPKDPNPGPNPGLLGKAAGCLPATQQVDLDVNNVRTTILNGGDMWWNLSNAKYEIPKIQPGQVAKHSLFSGALWIGGITNGSLKIAAQTYRQNGNDFYPGPLSRGTASVSAATCKQYDKIWKLSLREIEDYRKSPSKWSNPSDNIQSWPAMGNTDLGEAQFLAPFVNVGGDLTYEPELGDYPALEQDNPEVPDMMLFMIYNDKGNIHSETGGVQIGLEFHTHCFAFSTNDEVNNMTFYRTTVFNRSNETIDSTVFGQWVDPDLGNYSDDYVECDVKRNLGICYNGDDNDEGILGYGLNPPSVGVNFFEGPKRPDGSEIGLTKFVYYNNDFSVNGNPSRPEHYWGYLNGRWKDNAPITYGGNGRGGSDTASYMFPGNTDPAGRPLWNERVAGNQPQDRRFLQTAGSFSLLPGAVNRVTIGVVWARASSGGATGSFNLLKEASDKALILFKNNFALIAGPDAPTLEIVELDRKLVVKITNTENTQVELFTDSFAGPCAQKTQYKFQGYQVWQLKTASLPTDIYDQSQARLVAQFDVADGNARIVNTIFSPELEENVKKIMVEGADKGISHSFEITKDVFETGSDQNLVNFKNYHYVILAYAAAVNCAADPLQYLPGRRTINQNGLAIYTATPHDPKPSGYSANAEYGTGVPLTMVEGVGNGGNTLFLSEESIKQALQSPYYAKNRLYMQGFGPVTVKVIDPLKVPQADFVLGMIDTSKSTVKRDTLSDVKTIWYLVNTTTGDTQRSTSAISVPNEQLFTQWGISVQLRQSIMPGDAESDKDESNGFISSQIIWPGSVVPWLTGVVDDDPTFANSPTYQNSFNWVRSGSNGRPDYNNPAAHDFAFSVGTAKVPLDPRKNFSGMVDGTWGPYALASRWRSNSPTIFSTFGPAWDGGTAAAPGNGGASTDNTLADLYSVDFVLTPDKSKWSRCIVLETGDDKSLTVGNAEKMDIRKSPSVDVNGQPDGSGTTGFGWFPGYAINVETGERLNIIFGEDSSLPGENGDDMIWNPTENLLDRNTGRPVFGGKHYVYVMNAKRFDLGALIRYKGPIYDECQDYAARLASVAGPGMPSTYSVRKRQVLSQAMYTTMPILSVSNALRPMWQGLVPSEVTVRIRVKRPYASFSVDGQVQNDSMPLFTFSTKGLSPVIGDKAIAKKVLDKVSVVPNPYYAYSQYEDPGNQLDNRIKITNLPPNCTVRIYTQDGVLVRTIKKDDAARTYVEWDLKNDAKVPISSGVYLFHIKAPDIGEERIVKWFGIMRPVDYDTF